MRSDNYFCVPVLIMCNREITGKETRVKFLRCSSVGGKAAGKWSKAVAYEKKKANKTKAPIEYSLTLRLHSGFNKEKNKPNQPHISGYEQQYNRHIIYEK